MKDQKLPYDSSEYYCFDSGIVIWIPSMRMFLLRLFNLIVILSFDDCNFGSNDYVYYEFYIGSTVMILMALRN